MAEEKHLPERSCIICRKKRNKQDLLRLAKVNENKYVFDKDYKKQARGAYVCKSLDCLQKLSKHNKVKVSSEELLKMLNIIKKEEKNYINILNSMKNSGELVFGMNLLFENIEHIHYIIIAQDIADKNKNKIINKAKELNIPYVFTENRESLGTIFSRQEVNVIGIKDKKMARGLM
ncbi:MAG: DUF448 domain-containing protein [Fusobacterium sp.]|nr:DUF448 domain-containing protein [Fusobacterium sp.]